MFAMCHRLTNLGSGGCYLAQWVKFICTAHAVPEKKSGVSVQIFVGPVLRYQLSRTWSLPVGNGLKEGWKKRRKAKGCRKEGYGIYLVQLPNPCPQWERGRRNRPNVTRWLLLAKSCAFNWLLSLPFNGCNFAWEERSSQLTGHKGPLNLTTNLGQLDTIGPVQGNSRLRYLALVSQAQIFPCTFSSLC